MAFSKNEQNKDDEIMADINMTPLIDIMLVLLIIFMVTSSLSLESGLDIDIPKTSSQTKNQEGASVVISLDKSGALSVQGKIASWESLKEDVTSALKEAKTATVVFEGDQKSSLSEAIRAMDIAKEAGAEKFAIAAEATPAN